jgi:hypothetical protein
MVRTSNAPLSVLAPWAGSLRGMFEGAQTRMLPITNRVADYAPVAPACCNACRICATQGAISLIVGGAAAFGAALLGFARRFLPKAS